MPTSLPADRTYFLRRAKEERIKAITCECNAAARAHLDMATEYDRRAAMAMSDEVDSLGLFFRT